MIEFQRYTKEGRGLVDRVIRTCLFLSEDRADSRAVDVL